MPDTAKMEMGQYTLSEKHLVERQPTLQDVIDEMMSMNNRAQSVFNMPDETKDDVEKTTVKLCNDLVAISDYILNKGCREAAFK